MPLAEMEEAALPTLTPADGASVGNLVDGWIVGVSVVGRPVCL